MSWLTKDQHSRFVEVMKESTTQQVVYGTVFLREECYIDYVIHGKGTLEGCFAFPKDLEEYD